MLSRSHKVSRLVPVNRERPQTAQTTPSASKHSLSSEYTTHLTKIRRRQAALWVMTVVTSP